MPHLIRLRGPWTYHLLDNALQNSCNELMEATSEPARISMPALWSDAVGTGYQGKVRFVRPFGQPTGLESGDRVLLVVSGASQPVTISLNGRELSSHSRNAREIAADVTETLESRNLLVLDVDFARSTGHRAELEKTNSRRTQE